MIAEQLQAARAAHWRQKQSPLLTLDDAQSWLAQHPLCLYLPRAAQLPAPAPSFVEACLGSRQATPGAAAIEQAQELLTRLIASGSVVPLNLLGTVGEQPDFLAHSDALPFVLALRGDTDWKHAPQKSSGHKVSPLVLELWKILEQAGAMTAAEARETLGRELTEAAVLRALCELWQALRITPVLGEAGQPARWEMLRVRHRRALETGSTTSQVTALSLLVSMYLQSVYAATSEEIEVFLSPVTSRSRVREAVRGLSATRQIHTLSMDAQTYYFLENGLPEFAEVAAPSAPVETGVPPLPVQRPRPRKIQATARPDLPAAPPAAPASAPIFRRPKPAPGPAPAPAPRPERGPQPRPAQPAARAGWKTPARPGSSGRPAWKPAAKPPARGARWAQKDEGTRGGGKPRPAPGSRPPFVPGRSGTRPYARPNAAPPDTRSAESPEARGGARPQRPGAGVEQANENDPHPGPCRGGSPAPLPGLRAPAAAAIPRSAPRRVAGSGPILVPRARAALIVPAAHATRRAWARDPAGADRLRVVPKIGPRVALQDPRPLMGPIVRRLPIGLNKRALAKRAAEKDSGPPRGGRPSGPRPARFDAPRSDKSKV